MMHMQGTVMLEGRTAADFEGGAQSFMKRLSHESGFQALMSGLAALRSQAAGAATAWLTLAVDVHWVEDALHGLHDQDARDQPGAED